MEQIHNRQEKPELFHIDLLFAFELMFGVPLSSPQMTLSLFA
jgi:hypothetical protein